MNLPFSKQQFFEVFAAYNEAVWPMPLWLVNLAVLAVLAVLWRGRYTDQIVSTALGLLWLWSGVIYHLVFFRRVNPAALVFGVLFVIQSVGFFCCALRRTRLHFKAPRTEPRTLLGGFVLTYALILYPLIGRAIGHHWPFTPTFGAPCPLVLFTFGLLFWTEAGRPRRLLIIPLIWALIGSSAVLEFGMYEDTALLITALYAAAVLLPKRGTNADTRDQDYSAAAGAMREGEANGAVVFGKTGSRTSASGTSRSTKGSLP